jgi:RNA polymerase sigma-70 factor (ECF subfamily)
MMQAIRPMPDAKADSSVDLLVKAQSGDEDALNDLLAVYLPRLQRWASGRLPSGVRTMLDTGDLVQDAMINALRHLDTFEIRTEDALQAYLRRAVKNRITDLYRRAATRQARGEMPEEIVAAGTSPLEAAIGAETLEHYDRALPALNDGERQAIVLRIELGLTYEEMAAQLGKSSADAARMAATRAITRLAAEMRRAR